MEKRRSAQTLFDVHFEGTEVFSLFLSTLVPRVCQDLRSTFSDSG